MAMRSLRKAGGLIGRDRGEYPVSYLLDAIVWHGVRATKARVFTREEEEALVRADAQRFARKWGAEPWTLRAFLCVLWCFLFPAVISGGRRFLSPPFFRWASLLCGVFLGYFGLMLLWSSARPLS